MRLRKLLCAGLIAGSAATAMVATTGGSAHAAVTECDRILANYDYATSTGNYFLGLGYANIAAAWYQVADSDAQYLLAYC
jgi:hypothetical protein